MLAPGAARKTVMEWLMWQMGGFGRCSGRRTISFSMCDKIDYAATRYGNEANRLYGVFDWQLEGREYARRVFNRRHRDLPDAHP